MKCPECGYARLTVNKTVQTLKRCTRTLACPQCREGFESEESIVGRLGKLEPATRESPVDTGDTPVVTRGSPVVAGDPPVATRGRGGVGGGLSPIRESGSGSPGSLEAGEPTIGGWGGGEPGNVVPIGVTNHGAGVSTQGLLSKFSQVRARHVAGAIPWATPQGQKAWNTARDMTELLAADPGGRDAIEPTMDLLFRQAKAGEQSAKVLRDPAFGFGAWASQFSALREQLAHAAAADDGDDDKNRGFL